MHPDAMWKVLGELNGGEKRAFTWELFDQVKCTFLYFIREGGSYE